jgi:sugar lactone lactonase YvrE
MEYLPGTSSGCGIAGITGIQGNGLNQFSRPHYLYVDSSQNLYVSDVDNCRVMRWASDASSGSIVARYGVLGSSLNQLFHPSAVWVDSNSNVFLVDQFNHRVTKWALGASSGVVVPGITGSSGKNNHLHSTSSCIRIISFNINKNHFYYNKKNN